jgi:hypothetical protein
MVGKSNFTSENILPYSPQRDRALKTSKKEIKNVEQAVSLIPKKISPKYTQFKRVVKSIWVKRLLVEEI